METDPPRRSTLTSLPEVAIVPPLATNVNPEDSVSTLVIIGICDEALGQQHFYTKTLTSKSPNRLARFIAGRIHRRLPNTCLVGLSKHGLRA